mmetsp:Transcript_16812/g.23801  ORF Transcript_16812/g.23801 Transcript_16812/m.23801 type:complete len:109 (+) Transcript_16812:2770-3096(+)
MHDTKEERNIFDKEIKLLIGDFSKSTIKNHVISTTSPYKDFLINSNDETDDYDFDYRVNSTETINEMWAMPEADAEEYNELISSEVNDNLLGALVLLPINRALHEGIV